MACNTCNSKNGERDIPYGAASVEEDLPIVHIHQLIT